MKSFKVTEDDSLKNFTDRTYPQGSFAFAALLRAKDIKVNGARVRSDVKLKAGDEVAYYTTPKQESAVSHYCVYEDENILVADKPSGVTSEGLFSELSGKGKYFAVHRLDRNTQGLIIYAKNEAAERELLRAFRERGIKKTYLAACKNSFADKSAVLTAYLVKDEKKSFVKVYDREKEGAVKIITEYAVVQISGEAALVEIKLHTGRTHQIRAHLAHIGCPVVGDEKYGDGELNKRYGAKRQRLVAAKTEFDLKEPLAYLNGKAFQSRFVAEIKAEFGC